ncbi:PAS domain S-box protein [Rhodobacterales bacterium HKCCE3408]|nr:PAS domain S-box protein [Rhodobacterales bacterium HKCCE3408]
MRAITLSGREGSVSLEDIACLGFDNAPIGLVVTRYRLVETCNDAFAAMFGYEAAELAGKSIAALYPSNREFVDLGERGRAEMRSGPLYRDNRIMKRRDGSLFWCQVHGRSLGEGDVFAHCVWSFVDLSHQRRVVELTTREREIATLIVQGLTNKEIAARLGNSPRTIEAHRSRMLRKTGARGTGELIAFLVGLPG